jgi:hypothetical protein
MVGSNGGGEEFSNYDLVSMRLDLKCASCDRPVIKSGGGGGAAGGGGGAINQWCKKCKQFTQQCGVCEQVRQSIISSHLTPSLPLPTVSR